MAGEVIGNLATPSGPQVARQGTDADLGEWEQTWRKLQSAPDSVTLGDHWRVCGIKFRFRNYGELFRCLDLIEVRVARLDEQAPQRRYAPVVVGWMRAGAYAELGQTAEALKWAETAWNTLPNEYHEVRNVFQDQGGMFGLFFQNEREFRAVAIEAGGTTWMTRSSNNVGAGLNNPAGLDMRPQTIAMSLAAERAVLHQELGETELAKSALQDLYRWRDTTATLQGTEFYFAATGLSIGPLFAMGDYSGVVKNYEEATERFKLEESLEAWSNVSTLGLHYIWQSVFSISDSRRFAVALEDASRRLIYAESLSRLGDVERAQKTLDAMLAAPEVREMGSIYWAALYQRSQIAVAKGQRDESIRLLQEAAYAIERVRTTIAFEASKIGFAGNTQTVYASLVRALAEEGDWNGAFLAAERAKARALVDLLAQVRDLPAPPQAEGKVRELLARAAINESQSGLAGNGAATRGAIAAARSELATVAPEAASLVSVQTVPVADIAAKLAPGETLVDYFQADEALYAFVLNGATVTGFKLRADGLANDVRAFRRGIEHNDPATVDRGRALYERLVRPLESEIKGAKLVISPHGVLHYLPFAALLDGERYLIDRYSVRIMPSASALAYLKTDRPNKAGNMLALGNPDLGNPAFDLPWAQEEAATVARMFPNSKALVRKEASKTAVIELGSSFTMLHFASHGVFEPDAPLTSALFLAKGNEADGRLTVSDLYSMRLDADLVTLSACETALGKVASGDDVIGLNRGFLYAGARTIVASLWSVADVPTEKLMISFYQNLRKFDKREALRLAQLETRKAYPAPRFWAAFEITGSSD